MQLTPCLGCSYKQHWHRMQYQKEGVSQLQLDILLFLFISCPHQRNGETIYSSWLENPSFLTAFPLDSIGRKRKIQIAVRRLIEKGLLRGDYRKPDGNLFELIPLSPAWNEELWVERIVLTPGGMQLTQDYSQNSDLCHKFDPEPPQIEFPERRSKPKSLLVFLQALYGNALGAMGQILISAIHHHFSSKIPASDIAAVAETVWQLAESRDVFVSVGLQREEPTDNGGSVLAVSALPGLWLDVDLDTRKKSETPLPDSIEAVLEWIGRYPLKPSLIVDTGYGIQAYWLFAEQWVLPAEEDRARARDLARRFQEDLRKYLRDTSWQVPEHSNPSHAMRLPGTYNRTQQIPALVYIIEFHDDRRYRLDDFEAAFALEPVWEEPAPTPEDLEEAKHPASVIYLSHSFPRTATASDLLGDCPSSISFAGAEPCRQVEEYLPGFLTADTRETSLYTTFINTTEVLIQIAAEFELYHTPDRIRYAEVAACGYKEFLPLRSKMFRNILSYRFFQQSAHTPSPQALDDAVGFLEVKEQGTDLQEDICHRVARRGEAIYIDLAGPTGEVVKVTPEGWSLERDCPIHFLRPCGVLPLPVPRREGRIERLRPFVPVESDEDFHLLAAWILEAFREGMPKPVLYLVGEQGCGKSLMSRVLCALIDPTVQGIQAPPRNERELIGSLRTHWLLAYDNLSLVSPGFSDDLCRISTGGGYWTDGPSADGEEFSLRLNRPVVLNGIDNQASREDLLDRLLVLNLPPLCEENRREEKEFWREFSQEAPSIFGAILDGLSAALRNEDTVRMAVKPRMVDFARWASAAEEGLGWPAGTFLGIYQKNLSNVVEQTLKTDFIATAIIDLMKSQERWEGSAQSLMQELTPYIPEDIKKSKLWPTSPLTISTSIRKSGSYLRMVGIQVHKPDKPTWDQQEKKAKRVIVITKTGAAAS